VPGVSGLRALARGLSAACDHAAGWLLLALVLLNGASVFMRYVVGDSISWSEEGIRYLAVWITFLGSVAASWHDEHLDMNLFSELDWPVFQACHRCSLHLLNLAFSAVVAWQGWIYCGLNGAQTAPTTGLPMIYIYAAIALGGALLTFVHLVKAVDSALSVRRA
jgi:TRAP-type C4-dicarboxylate transport system permease small subunit